MRILITGAGGNLGSKLRFHLQDRYALTLTSRNDHSDTKIFAADLSIWDETWVRLFRGIDAVVHLAANPDPASTWSQLVAPNIDLVLNVCEACVANGVRRVVFASSNHVMSGYRQSNIPEMHSETPPNPGNAYGTTKLFGERIGKSFSERHDLSWIAVRIGTNRPRHNVPGSHMDDWSRKMWLSDRDYCQLMECCINASDALHWSVINGVSNNSGTHWDLAEARALVGYEPQDDAFDPRWD